MFRFQPPYEGIKIPLQGNFIFLTRGCFLDAYVYKQMQL